MGDGARETVGIDVCEPKHDGSDRHECGDLAGLVRVGLRPCDDDCEDDDRAVEEAAEPFARRRTTDTDGRGTTRLLDHALIIRFHRRSSQVSRPRVDRAAGRQGGHTACLSRHMSYQTTRHAALREGFSSGSPALLRVSRVNLAR